MSGWEKTSARRFWPGITRRCLLEPACQLRPTTTAQALDSEQPEAVNTVA
jgi:hypothetical protein